MNTAGPDNDIDTERLILDVNALAVFLVDNHPGHEYLAQELASGLQGEDLLLVHDFLPLCAQWILTTDWGIERYVARNAVTSFLQQPIQIVAADRTHLLDAYAISAEKNHDVYDCFFLALARHYQADALLSTDRDFETLCEDESFEWRNPVPETVLEQFHTFNE